MSDFALTQGDKDSSTWRKLRKHFESERANLRERNDSPSLDAEKTAILRGRIAQLTDLLALDKPAPEEDA